MKQSKSKSSIFLILAVHSCGTVSVIADDNRKTVAVRERGLKGGEELFNSDQGGEEVDLPEELGCRWCDCSYGWKSGFFCHSCCGSTPPPVREPTYYPVLEPTHSPVPYPVYSPKSPSSSKNKASPKTPRSPKFPKKTKKSPKFPSTKKTQKSQKSSSTNKTKKSPKFPSKKKTKNSPKFQSTKKTKKSPKYPSKKSPKAFAFYTANGDQGGEEVDLPEELGCRWCDCSSGWKSGFFCQNCCRSTPPPVREPTYYPVLEPTGSPVPYPVYSPKSPSSSKNKSSPKTPSSPKLPSTKKTKKSPKSPTTNKTKKSPKFPSKMKTKKSPKFPSTKKTKQSPKFQSTKKTKKSPKFPSKKSPKAFEFYTTNGEEQVEGAPANNSVTFFVGGIFAGTAIAAIVFAVVKYYNKMRNERASDGNIDGEAVCDI